MLPVEDIGTKIKLQGMEEGTFAIPKIRVVTDTQVAEGNTKVNERYTILAEEIVSIEENSDYDEITLDSDTNDSRE